MAKRKITVSVDEDLVEAVQSLGATSLSSVVNEALVHEVDRRARAAALDRLLGEWDAAFGPVGEKAKRAARAALDDLDATAVEPPSRRGRRAPA